MNRQTSLILSIVLALVVCATLVIEPWKNSNKPNDKHTWTEIPAMPLLEHMGINIHHLTRIELKNAKGETITLARTGSHWKVLPLNLRADTRAIQALILEPLSSCLEKGTPTNNDIPPHTTGNIFLAEENGTTHTITLGESLGAGVARATLPHGSRIVSTHMHELLEQLDPIPLLAATLNTPDEASVDKIEIEIQTQEKTVKTILAKQQGRWWLQENGTQARTDLQRINTYLQAPLHARILNVSQLQSPPTESGLLSPKATIRLHTPTAPQTDTSKPPAEPNYTEICIGAPANADNSQHFVSLQRPGQSKPIFLVLESKITSALTKTPAFFRDPRITTLPISDLESITSISATKQWTLTRRQHKLYLSNLDSLTPAVDQTLAKKAFTAFFHSRPLAYATPPKTQPDTFITLKSRHGESQYYRIHLHDETHAIISQSHEPDARVVLIKDIAPLLWSSKQLRPRKVPWLDNGKLIALDIQQHNSPKWNFRFSDTRGWFEANKRDFEENSLALIIEELTHVRVANWIESCESAQGSLPYQCRATATIQTANGLVQRTLFLAPGGRLQILDSDILPQQGAQAQQRLQNTLQQSLNPWLIASTTPPRLIHITYTTESQTTTFSRQKNGLYTSSNSKHRLSQEEFAQCFENLGLFHDNSYCIPATHINAQLQIENHQGKTHLFNISKGQSNDTWKAQHITSGRWFHLTNAQAAVLQQMIP